MSRLLPENTSAAAARVVERLDAGHGVAVVRFHHADGCAAGAVHHVDGHLVAVLLATHVVQDVDGPVSSSTEARKLNLGDL
ncbi:MAG: hypothetical protein M3Q27_10415 [Actinomycetota bacterium]|nr:hypothetical protein [Actinomycetota bacterium]